MNRALIPSATRVGGDLVFALLRVNLCYMTRFHIIQREFALYGRSTSTVVACVQPSETPQAMKYLRVLGLISRTDSLTM